MIVRADLISVSGGGVIHPICEDLFTSTTMPFAEEALLKNIPKLEETRPAVITGGNRRDVAEKTRVLKFSRTFLRC